MHIKSDNNVSLTADKFQAEKSVSFSSSAIIGKIIIK